jgi:hypothetical protein
MSTAMNAIALAAPIVGLADSLPDFLDPLVIVEHGLITVTWFQSHEDDRLRGGMPADRSPHFT